MTKLRSIFTSITPKFILIIILFAIVLNMSIWAFFRFSTSMQPRHIVPSYIYKMTEYVINDIGSPPDTVKARQISDELNLEIRYQSNKFNWSSSDRVPDLQELSGIPEFQDNYPIQDRFTVPYHKRPIHIFKMPNGIFVIYPMGPQDFFSIERAILVLTIIVIVIFIPMILILKWLFSPIKKLSYAVDQIAEGNYDVDTGIRRKDEFGELSNSIKEMASKIKNSIKSKEQLLMDVSHELRTPLTRIKLGLEVGSSKEKINDDVREIEEMINTLLDSYRFDTLFYEVKPERKKIIPIIEEVIDEYGGEKRLVFDKHVNQNTEALVDAGKFKIVLRNVLDNALKFSKDDVRISVNENSSNTEIIVQDKGQGIPARDLDFVFEPFYRADKSRSKTKKGFGLGLSISRKIMDKHNGHIVIKSEEGKGTEVKLILNK